MTDHLTAAERDELVRVARRSATKAASDAKRARQQRSFVLAAEWERKAKILTSACDKLTTGKSDA